MEGYAKAYEEEIKVDGGVNPDDDFDFECRVRAGMKPEDQGGEFRVLLRKDEEVTTEKKAESSVDAPVKKGERVGEFTYMLEGEEIKSLDIVTLEAIEKRDKEWCFDKIAEMICL